MSRRKDHAKSTSKEMAQQAARGSKPIPVRPIKPKNLRLVVDYKVLAERNQAVMPVGAWVESGQDCQVHPSLRAVLTEEHEDALCREKEESLRRFQESVRKRVAQQARVRKRQQLQKSYQTVEEEGRVLQQSSTAARRLTPRKNVFPSGPQGELAICSPGSRWVSAQGLDPSDADEAGTQHTHQLVKVTKQVRRRLASCQTVSPGAEASELPGGLWKVSPTRDKPTSRLQGSARADQGAEEDEEIPLIGQHDRPLGLEGPASSEGQNGRAATFRRGPVCERLLREPYPTGPSPGFGTDYRASQILWPGEDQEELKRQRQSQFLMYRRLFMDIEREQVKELCRHRKHLKRIARIKAEKEQQRTEEERRIESLKNLNEERMEMAEREHRNVEELRTREMESAEETERKRRARKDREATRFVEALRVQMEQRMALEKVELPPLCCCGDSFWDSHPETCANNCVFYNNPKAYAHALQSVLFSCELREGYLSHRASARKIASAHALSPRK
ncbi:coiled-coil domain-containing protein 15 [Anguilla rostrata]|uniref:coiled-coil domain-containing protein 15 n=1 Tax=Anguilla rostrata TaxID=7938 RepID=UPI0030D018BD